MPISTVAAFKFVFALLQVQLLLALALEQPNLEGLLQAVAILVSLSVCLVRL